MDKQTEEQTSEAVSDGRHYDVVIHSADGGGFWTEVPALPGCGSQGETIAEALEMTKDAIQGFLASMRGHGERPPEERTRAAKVTFAG